MSKSDEKQKRRMSVERRRRLANAERQRRFYWNRKEKLRAAGDPTDKIAHRKFNEFVAEVGLGEFLTYIEWAGIKPDAVPTFNGDDDPGFMRDYDVGEKSRGSIGLAERMVGCLLDAATELGDIINRYKREEIDRAIADLEAGDVANPATRTQAVGEIVRLTKLREQLDRRYRRDFPQWRVNAL